MTVSRRREYRRISLLSGVVMSSASRCSRSRTRSMTRPSLVDVDRTSEPVAEISSAGVIIAVKNSIVELSAFGFGLKSSAAIKRSVNRNGRNVNESGSLLMVNCSLVIVDRWALGVGDCRRFTHHLLGNAKRQRTKNNQQLTICRLPFTLLSCHISSESRMRATSSRTIR